MCVQVNPYFIPQNHESNEEEPDIHAGSVSADTNTFGFVHSCPSTKEKHESQRGILKTNIDVKIKSARILRRAQN